MHAINIIATPPSGAQHIWLLHDALDMCQYLCLLSGEVTAVEALRQACQSLKQLCGHMKSNFTEAYEQYEHSRGAAVQPMAEG